MGGNDLVGASFQGNSRFNGDNILQNSEGTAWDHATVVFTSSGEFRQGLTLKSGGAGDTKVAYSNSDTIAEVSGEAILDELIVIDKVAGGQQTAKVLVGGNVIARKILDRDGVASDAAFRDHADMRNVRFVDET